MLCVVVVCCCFLFQAEDGIRYLVRSRGLGDVYKRQRLMKVATPRVPTSRSTVVCTWVDGHWAFNFQRPASAGFFMLGHMNCGAVSYKHLTLPTSDLV